MLTCSRSNMKRFFSQSGSIVSLDYGEHDVSQRIRSRLPFKPWQKAAIAFGSALGALLDPSRADLVVALGETTGSLAFRNMLVRMKQSSEGRRILTSRPRVTSATVGHAWDLPDNTFGAAYAKFMGKRNFSPDDRPPVRFMDSEELAYVATRAREVHDFWHVLFKLPTNLIGESALKMLEFQQIYLPMCFLCGGWHNQAQTRSEGSSYS
ncbi:hypothetical protein L7F22_025236 [Adiantum nelumboides]|nr:hypothetical protein [Adiantum nelumboides]